MFARCLSETISMTNAPGGRIAFGKNVRAWVGSPMTEAIAASRAQDLAVVFARSKRLDRGSITVSITQAKTGDRYAFFIRADARTTTQIPISMIVGVSAVSVDLLAQQGSTS